MKLESILATKGSHVITIRPEQSIREAIASLVKHNIGALVVINEKDKPVGILSERDIVRAAAKDEALFSHSVAELMTKNVISALPQDDVESVAHTMTEKRIRHVPVIDQGKLVGIVSIGDVVKAQRDHYRGEVDTLQTQILATET